jgi:mono/diheme cytochrome c family protein
VHGKQVFVDNCAACHGDDGQAGIKDRLVGGKGTLASDMPVKTVGSF